MVKFGDCCIKYFGINIVGLVMVVRIRFLNMLFLGKGFYNKSIVKDMKVLIYILEY